MRRAILLCFIISFCVTVSFVSAEEGDVAKEQFTLYKAAGSKLANIPDNFSQLAESVLKRDWMDDEEIISLINDNKEAIDVFKQATQQESDRFIFGQKPEIIDATTKIPIYINEMKLLRLVFLEAKKFESKKLYSKAEENYLAASRFMIHLSQQKFGILLTTIVQYISFDIVSLYLEQSLDNESFSQEYKRSLLENLLSIRENQDFLESAFREEAEMVKNTARTIEREFKEGASFSELFGLDEAGVEPEKQTDEYKAKEKKLTAMLAHDFFGPFYEQIDATVDDFAEVAILAAKEGNPEIYEKKFKAFTDSLEINRNPLHGLLYRLKQIIIERKSLNLIVADICAKVYLVLSIPKCSRLIERNFTFYNKLNLLIEKCNKLIKRNRSVNNIY